MPNFEEQLQKAQDVIRSLNHKVDSLQQQLNMITQETLDVESLAGKRVPYSYVIPIQLAQGASALAKGSVSLSRSGPFFAERLICTLHIETVQDGGNADWVGRFLPISSRPDYALIWPAGATGTIAYDPPLDFEFGYESNASDRQRQDKYIPGDVLSRFDNDGIMPVSDIFPGGATITFKVNPLRAVGGAAPWSDQDGVATFMFTAVFQGYKIIQPTQV